MIFIDRDQTLLLPQSDPDQLSPQEPCSPRTVVSPIFLFYNQRYGLGFESRPVQPVAECPHFINLALTNYYEMDIPEFLLNPDKQKDDDNAITEIVKELSGILGIIRKPLRGIVWSEATSFPLDWPEFALRGELVLRSELKEKLTPIEWRPLLASSLVFETRFRGRERLLRAYALFSIAISIFLTALFFVFITRYVLSTGPVHSGTARAYAFITIGFFFAALFLLIAIPAPYFRRLRLRADQITCEKTGTREDLLAVLKKIEDMSIRRGRIERLAGGAPPISRRIQNLAS